MITFNLLDEIKTGIIVNECGAFGNRTFTVVEDQSQLDLFNDGLNEGFEVNEINVIDFL